MTVNIEGLGKITASKEVLNEIALAFGSASKFDRSRNRNSLADKRYKVCNSIYDALDESGYYND